ncbi:hypothetical protein [Streptomyces sp. NPDC005533]|uniref:hypothetical protein n=1 Tax=Streptomyces sp. NPDC005533 TaxID=3364723 RepID=UPI00369B292F
MNRRVSADVGARVGGLLEELVESGRKSGLQVAAYLDGAPIVDAHAGWADRPGARRLGSDTLTTASRRARASPRPWCTCSPSAG